MISKQKLIQSLNDLLQYPGNYVPRSEVDRMLTPFVDLPSGDGSQLEVPFIANARPQNPSAIEQLDSILKKFKEKKS